MEVSKILKELKEATVAVDKNTPTYETDEDWFLLRHAAEILYQTVDDKIKEYEGQTTPYFYAEDALYYLQKAIDMYNTKKDKKELASDCMKILFTEYFYEED